MEGNVEYREREIDVLGKTLVITQRFGSPDTLGDHIVWDAALSLVKFFEKQHSFIDAHQTPLIHFENKRVLELGSGTGICGIVACMLGADVTLTEQKDILELLDLNINNNNISSSIRFAELQWGLEYENNVEEIVRKYGPFDCVVMSDCIYPKREEWKKFIHTVRELGSLCDNCLFIMSQELRSGNEIECLQELKKNFMIQKVSKEDLDDVYSSDDVGVFFLKSI